MTMADFKPFRLVELLEAGFFRPTGQALAPAGGRRNASPGNGIQRTTLANLQSVCDECLPQRYAHPRSLSALQRANQAGLGPIASD